nr:hypothetical protein [Tanacetum cinerariifolium]
MSTQQEIYDVGSENCPLMLNKENYVPWLSHLLRYAKSRPNEKLIYNSIINGPYVTRMIPEPGIANQNGTGNVVTTRADGNANENNGNQIRCYNCRGLGHLARNCIQASTSGTQRDKAPFYDSNGSAEVQLHDNFYNNEIFNMFTQEEQYTELLEPILEPYQVQQNDSNVIFTVSSVEQSRRIVEQHSATVEETRAYHESLFHNLAAEVKKVNSVYRKIKETNVELTTKLARYKNQVLKIVQLKRRMSKLNFGMIGTKNVKNANMKKKLHDKAYNDMQQKIELLQAQLGDLKGKSKDTPCVSDTLNPLPQKLENEKVELEYQVSQNVDKTNDLSNPVTLNSIPTTKESKVIDNDKVIAPGMFRINSFKNFKEEKPRPRSNKKNDMIPSASKSGRIKNKEVKVEEHPRNLLLSKNKKHMSSECNNVKLATQNDKSRIVYAMCKRCLITTNHDVCVLNYVNGVNSRGKKQKENVSNIANQTKHMPQVKKPKKEGFTKRLALPKPSKPSMCLRWSPTGRIFDLCGKLIRSSDSECYLNMFVVRRLGLFQVIGLNS